MTVDRLVRFLAARGHSVDLLCFAQNQSEDRELRQGLGGVCREIETVRLPPWRSYAVTALSLPSALPMQVAYFRSAAMQRAVERRVAGGDYDLVYAHLIRMSEYARSLRIPKVLGMQISQALNLSRLVEHTADPARRAFYAIEARKVRPYEAAVCADFDRVFLCGPADIEELEKTAPVANALICPHGQDVPSLERVRAVEREPAAIVFSGVMATYTNVAAATWFARDIFPRVEREVPGAQFWIVGRSPQRSVRALARPGRVLVTGEVPDVYDWLCRASVAVDPLKIGAGMQNKIVQAMACELPVVATTVANEGIGAAPDREILLRDDAESLANGVVALLRDSQARERLGRAARRFVEHRWTWEALFENLEKGLREVSATD
jgi:glycosyltransferase involved in cell wall biosynthesis